MRKSQDTQPDPSMTKAEAESRSRIGGEEKDNVEKYDLNERNLTEEAALKKAIPLI